MVKSPKPQPETGTTLLDCSGSFEFALNKCILQTLEDAQPSVTELFKLPQLSYIPKVLTTYTFTLGCNDEASIFTLTEDSR